MNFLKRIYFHPFFLALYPVLYLLYANIRQVYVGVAIRPAIVSLTIAALVFILSGWALKSWQKGALLTSLALVFFFSYGHLLYFLRSVTLFGDILGRHRYLALPYLALFLFLAWALIRSRRDFSGLTQILNGISLILVIFLLAQIGLYSMRVSMASAKTSEAVKSSNSLSEGNQQKRPDVYIIVLDGYARADQLKADLGYDNQPFLNDLEKLGFHVVRCSRSNYNSTEYSLASMLNLDYMSAFGNDFSTNGPDRDKLPALVKESRVRQQLEALGYKTVAFETGYYITDWWGVDQFLTPENSDKRYIPETSRPTIPLRPFEAMLLKSTATSLILDGQTRYFKNLANSVNYPYADHIAQVLFTLDKLPTLPYVESPKLVYAHLVIPHKPLVFDAQGNIQTDPGFYGNQSDPINFDYFKQGYIDQVEYINSRILPILRTIIQESSTPPVILLFGDHGYYWGNTRHANLAAYYLPGGGDQALYPTMSNVNAFRVIFDRYFSASYKLLPDISYTEGPNGQFQEVEEELEDCKSP